MLIFLHYEEKQKRLVQDPEGALKDLEWAHELQPKLVYILGMQALVEQQLGGILLKQPLVDYTIAMVVYPTQSNYLNGNSLCKVRSLCRCIERPEHGICYGSQIC